LTHSGKQWRVELDFFPTSDDPNPMDVYYQLTFNPIAEMPVATDLNRNVIW